MSRRIAGRATVLAVVISLTALTTVGCSESGNSGPSLPSVPTTAAVPATTVTVAKPAPGTELLGPTTTDAEPQDTDRPPVVATLAWLSRRAPQPGLQIQVADGSRWQGPVPGEYAVIKDGGYRWFGPDGSAVGCTPAGKCVGVDAQGYTAVVRSIGQPRMVYRPNGAFLGRFDALGRRIAGGSPGLIAAEIAATGVDVAALLDESTRPVPYAGGVTGDPHFLTAGGTRFTTQLTGQFYARYGDPEREIQVRVEPMPHREDAAIVTAVALTAAGSRIEFTSSGRLTVDGRSTGLDSDFDQLSIDDGPEVGRWAPDADRQARAAVVWADGGTVVMIANPVLGMTVVAQFPTRTGVSGLFGTGGGANDLRDRSGSANDPATVVPSWLVGAGDGTLFDEQVPTVPGFPSQIAAPPADAAAESDAACREAGVLLVPDRAACVFDVSLTGDDGFAAGHAMMVRPAARPIVPPEIAARWAALVLGATDGAVDLPAGSLIETSLGGSAHSVYRIPVARSGEVELQFAAGCPGSTGPPDEGAAAARIFDSTGRAVSSRAPLCGLTKTASLAPGDYFLVADGGSGPATTLKVQVVLP